MNIQIQETFGKYLGIQSDFRHSKKAFLEEVRKNNEEKLIGWAKQFLSEAETETLIKDVAMAISNYTMSCFKLPISLCKEMGQLIAKYYWQGQGRKRGIHWVSWGKITQTK